LIDIVVATCLKIIRQEIEALHKRNDPPDGHPSKY